MSHLRAALLVLVGLLWGAAARAGDPELLWRTIETEHFRISYHEPLGEVAQRLARIAELSHAKLAPVLGRTPRFRTEVLLTDDTDYANGSATALPFNTVRMYLTAPDDRSELSDYDDWLYALFVHEYTHILHLDTINGLPKWINYLAGFGVNTLYAPNQIQPRFFIEGLAVVQETAQSSGGRLRSSIFDMYLRAHALEGKFLRLDQVTNNTRLFPRGNVAYLYGSAFLRHIGRRYGDDVLRRISQRYGGCWSPDCWIPWGMNRALRHATGERVGYGELYKDWKRERIRHYEAQRDEIARGPLGLTQGRPISPFKVSVDRPQIVAKSPGSSELSVLWLDSDPYRRPALWNHDLATGKTRVELEIDGATGLSVSSDGRLAVMSRYYAFRATFSYQDLVLYHRERRELYQLTEALRVDNPALSPDGRRVAFEVNSQGSRRLGVMELPPTGSREESQRIDRRAVAVPEVWRARAARPVEFPLSQERFSQAYTPAWSPDGRSIAVSLWQQGGYRDIVIVDLATRALRYVTRDRALDLHPRFSADGKWLFFSSDRTGVFNLYAHHLASEATFQVSSVVNGLFNPALSPDGKLCAYVGFVAEGYRIETIELDPRRFRLAPAAPARPDPPQLPPPDAPTEEAERYEVKRYNPARTFFRTPLSMLNLTLPISAPGPYGQSFGLQFSTADLVGLHSLVAGLTLHSDRPDATGFFSRYTYGRLWNSLYLDVARSMYPRGGLRLNGQNRAYDEETWSVGVGTDLPILRDAARTATMSIAYSFAYWRNASKLPQIGPDELTPVLPEVGRYAALSLAMSYGDARRFLYSVGPEKGRSLSLGLVLAHPALGSQYTVYALRLTAGQYIGIPWPSRFLRNHTLLLSYEFGISGGDLQRRGLYYLGGFPTSEDFLRAALLGQRPGQPRLRGYAPGAFYGDQMHVLNVEYRFPIVWIERGYETVPFYLWRLHAAVYSDVGAAFFGKLTADKIAASVGGELRLDGTLGYYLPFMFQLGYAHGFMDGADHRVYFLLNNPL
jgi:hypothetical protein